MHPGTCYFALAFAISWGGILAVIRGGAIPAPPDEANRLFALVYFAMLAGPSVAGLAMTWTIGGFMGLRQYRARLLRWRVAPSWYAVALLTAPLALALTALVLSQFSSDFVPAILGAGSIDPAGPIAAGNVQTLLLVAVAVGLGAGFFEELGWTGFAVPTLLNRLGVVSTGLVVGVAWGGWHFLAIWWGSARSFGSVPVPLFLFVALFTFLPPYRLLMVRLYARTGSLLVNILMHASLTSSMIILGPPVMGAESVIYNLAFATTLWVIVALTLAADHMRFSRQTERSDAHATFTRGYDSSHRRSRRLDGSNSLGQVHPRRPGRT
jgi:membrane protease YdiL (CAAX protease family)